MEVPQMKTPKDRELLKSEFQRFITALEELSGVKITAERLKAGILKVNNRRKAIARLNALRAAVPVPISGLDALLVNQIAFYDNPERFTDSVNKLCDELEARIEKGEGVAPKDTPRLIISGCPMAVPNWKLPAIIEGSGAVIVGEESCVGERGSRNLVDDSGSDLESLLEAVVDRYFLINCAIFTPNPERIERVREMAEEYKADGVIHYALQFCSPYLVESYRVERELGEALPVLRIETDYSTEDAGQLKTRVEAFREMIGK